VDEFILWILKKRGAASKPIEVIEINLMTGMNVVETCLEAEKCFASSSEISKGNEKSSGLFIAIYQASKEAGDKREWKILMATVKGMSMILGKYCSCRFSV
jgi:5-methyltetrahydrofolate--homocysteine methyltransferase